jgi:hypothetical protein
MSADPLGKPDGHGVPDLGVLRNFPIEDALVRKTRAPKPTRRALTFKPIPVGKQLKPSPLADGDRSRLREVNVVIWKGCRSDRRWPFAKPKWQYSLVEFLGPRIVGDHSTVGDHVHELGHDMRSMLGVFVVSKFADRPVFVRRCGRTQSGLKLS